MSPDMPAMTDDALNTIRARNERLREVPFDGTHDGREHGDNCVPCELVRGVGDVTALLEENKQLRGRLAGIGETEVEWAVRWYEPGNPEAVHVHKDSEADARHWMRLARERGLPKHMTRLAVVKAIVGDWQELPDV